MSTELATIQGEPLELSVLEVKAQVQKVQELMRAVMKEGDHYGVIPGTNKPTLLKPGAEKLCLVFRLDPEYESVEHYDGDHLTVKSKCVLYHLVTGKRVGSGEGSCSTKESKYAYRAASLACPECGKDAIIKGKVEYGGGWLCFTKKGGCGAKFADDHFKGVEVGKIANDNLADQYNTILKMSNKRSLVAAVLNATAASDIFTQDLEDMAENGALPRQRPMQPAPSAKPAPVKEQVNYIAKLGDEIMHYCNGDKDLAKDMLKELTQGKTTLKQLNQTDAAAAYFLFERQYLSAGTDDDGRQPGQEG